MDQATNVRIPDTYVAEVEWYSPRHGGYADLTQKFLSVGDLCEGTKYIHYSNRCGTERYLFAQESDALTFKTKVENGYQQSPQYFVIDDEGKVVIEDGQPVVAWVPAVDVNVASQVELDLYFSGAFA